MYIRVKISTGGINAHGKQTISQALQLDPTKIKRAKKALGARTETETIERALNLVIEEKRSNRLAWEANDRFLRSGIRIKDVYGKLSE